jgi:hypothetical protein
MSNSLGTLSAPIVALDCLQILKKRFPILTSVATDFSKDAVKYNQQVISRIVTPVSAADYSTSTGYTASGSTTTDVPVTINKHKHVSISFNDQELSSTARNLIEEQKEAAAYSLGRQISNDLWALVNPVNFSTNTNVNAATASAISRQTLLTGRQNLVLAGASLNRQGIVSAQAFNALAADVNIFAKLYTDADIDFEDGTIQGYAGFKKITEFAEMPTGTTTVVTGNTHTSTTIDGMSSTVGLVVGNAISGSGVPANATIASIVSSSSITISAATTSTATGVTLTVVTPVHGLLGAKEGLVLATRVPVDPGMFVGDVPVPALIGNVSDEDTGLTIQYRYIYNPTLGTLQMTLTLMYGVAIGVAAHALLVTSTV